MRRKLNSCGKIPRRMPASSHRHVPRAVMRSARAPQRAADLVWAMPLAETALVVLGEEYVLSGKAALHARLLPLLTDRSADGSYAAMASELRMSEGALRVATHQLRRRFGEL